MPPISHTRLFKLACALVRFDHIASRIVNANHGAMGAAAMFCVTECIRDCVWLAVPEPTERQRTGKQIDAEMIFKRSHFLNVL
jgi:hypothetical protein